MTDVNLSSVVGAALSPGAYGAGLALQAVNANSVALGLYLADTRNDLANFFDALTFGGVDISSTSVDALLVNSTDLAAIAANPLALQFIATGSAEILAAVVGDSTAFAALLASQDARYTMWSNDAIIDAVLADAGAVTQIRAAGTLRSKAEDDQTPVSMETGVTGGDMSSAGKYLLLGVSIGSSFGRTVTFTTRRAGSARPDSGTTTGNHTDARVDVFCPIETAMTFVLSASLTGTNTVYWLDLDCTPAA